MTYWHNDSCTGFCRSCGSVVSTPMQLFQNERRSSTTVTKANGVPSSVAASWASRSNGSSAPVSSSPVRCTAASRSGSKIWAGSARGAGPPAVATPLAPVPMPPFCPPLLTSSNTASS
ncbi:hypothetical protein ACN28G_05875 [Micromonospora sp. WMMA1923]|uniref:hypothetical protein n=1 Tax=Micromonospora sp. WMMA1923 TaxID=3404125 RepID=UPI003B955F8C